MDKEQYFGDKYILWTQYGMSYEYQLTQNMRYEKKQNKEFMEWDLEITDYNKIFMHLLCFGCFL